MRPASSNKAIRGSGKPGLTVERIALAGVFLISTSLTAQMLPLSLSSPQLKSAAAAEANPSAAPGATTPSPAAVPVQQRVLSYDPSRVAPRPAPRLAQKPAGIDPFTLHLLVGRSLFLNTPERLRRVYVSNPTVLDSLTSSPHQLVLTAKAAGSASLVLWSEAGQGTLYTILADLDVDGLKDSLAQALPGDQVEVKALQGRVYLSGTVGSDEAALEAVKLAGNYSKDVVNSLVVDPRHESQVELRVRIAELDRTKLSQSGFNFFSLGKNTGAVTTGSFSPPSFPQVGGSGGTQALVQDALNLFYFNSDLNMGATLRLLQDKGILQVLAEPNLTTVSGQTAKFLAGGEFPFPVIQGSNGGFTSVTIQFRPYGVRLEFTPRVNPDGTIRLKVSPEVSALDYTNAVKISGYTIPAISTRKADTEIELKNGQSFAISGLLDHRITDQFTKIPGIGDIPILGQLFRSKNLNQSVTELIVIVTPTVVEPLQAPVSEPPAVPAWAVPFLQPGQFDKDLPHPPSLTPTPSPADRH
jgi:pilus assembly protein CpaC